MPSFDNAEDRPEHITNILNGLDRYNPETTSIFQDYVSQQCEYGTYDCYANLALLKLYQFNPHLARDETITNILVKSLTVFPSTDFSLCCHLLPPSLLTTTPASSTGDLHEAVQKLTTLNTQLESCQFKDFWNTLDSDDLYADLIADVSGFEDTIRKRIAVVTNSSIREITREMLEGWLNLSDDEFDTFVKDTAGFSIEGNTVIVPLNKDNEARPTITRESVKFDQFSRVIRRAYEQPA
ncbi:eukaryotic translation initiation factor 3 subunit K [Drechslerella stenobrocha 248]|uniref:Eukaryotic translation initiation factor 3 subunit K n=1 Tax=Drechslerella stenobrocha 248 TaxID=1043628 RepID=W7HNG6_9PEZI|nr:eukaryotic translation initiation factor 3 subunit K [Drechslerella stenobrocha 248]